MNSSRNSYKVAMCGILTALSVVIMLICGFLGFLTYAAPMIAGGLLIVPVKEYGTRTALTMYVAVSVLSIILVTDKELSLFYLLLFGHYPIIQPKLDKIESVPLRRVLKAVIFNGCAILSVWLAQVIFSVPIFEENWSMWLLVVIYLAMANVCFVLYDRALRQFYTIYDIKIAPILSRKIH